MCTETVSPPDAAPDPRACDAKQRFTREYQAFAPARDIIAAEVPGPRSVLYVGMGQDWHYPITAADADGVWGVDPAYEGLWLSGEERAALKRSRATTARAREVQFWLFEPATFSTLAAEADGLLGEVRHTTRRSRRAVRLTGIYEGRARRIWFIPEGVEEYLGRTNDQFPVVVTRRTFPSAFAWARIIEHLPVGGLLLTTGYGWGKPDPWETLSGGGIHESPLPIYFPPALLGLSRRWEAQGATTTLYHKDHPVRAAIVADVISRGGRIDRLLNPDALANGVRSWDESGVSFYPKAVEELPILWEPDGRIGRLAQLIGGVDPRTARHIWQEVADRAARIGGFLRQEETEHRGHFDRILLPNFIAAGYLSEGDSLYERIVRHLQMVAQTAGMQAKDA